MKETNQELIEFVKERYFKKFPDKNFASFIGDWAKYEAIPAFGANENIHSIMTDYSKREELPDVEENSVKETYILTPEVHWVLRMATQYYLTKAFEAMKINMDDPNIAEQSCGKGTPGRIAKLWVGGSPDDDSELGCMRFSLEPYIACFPNTDNNHSVITKEVEIISTCSHHFLPFSTFGGGKAIISYIPNKYVLGISKLSRFTNWVARRFWLQEDLTKCIGETIKRIADTEDVYVRLEGLKHSCETFRGARQHDASLTTEFKSGYFKDHSV